jgi:phosphotransferase system  glucose/maltose/N-acetylglucosamine-specific IIC component/phosphotransferase system IIB component
MSAKYEALGKEIIAKVGGAENIISLRHCQTRLRLQLRDDNKADKEGLEALDGVAKVMIGGGMFQVVIGMHVDEVYEEAIKFYKPEDGTENQENVTPDGKNQKIFDRVVSFISAVFTPIVPALAGAGMVRALLALLVAFNLVETTDITYIIINMIGDAAFAFMPIMLAYTAAQRLKCNPMLAVIVAGIMVHPTWGNLVGAGESISLFGIIPLYLIRYTASVIPIILVVMVQAPLERWLNKVIHNSLRLVFVPMIVFAVMGVLALSVLGPIGGYIGEFLNGGFVWMGANVPWLPPTIVGATLPVMVMFGIHHGVGPVGLVSLASLGYDAIFGPGALCSNIAQGTSALLVGLLSKDKGTRQIAISSGIAGLMGTTEPALFGINLPKKYPLIAAMIGGGAGGFFAGITGTRRFATGSSGLPAVPMYIGENTMQFFIQIMIALAVTIVVTSILTFIFYKKYEPKLQK